MIDTDDAKDNTSRYTVPALARGLEILSYFSRERRILSGAQLAKMAGLPRASVFRMLQTLEHAGYLDRVGEPGTHPSYRLGVAVLRLGFEFLSSMELTDHGRPVLESLSDACGYSSHIVVRDGRDVVVVAKALGRLATFHAIAVGARLPAHATVLGRVLMGGATLAELEQLYAHHPMKVYTLQTPATPQVLKALIDEAAAAGYAVSQGAFESGISTIAAPVFNEDKKFALPSASLSFLRVSPTPTCPCSSPKCANPRIRSLGACSIPRATENEPNLSDQHGRDRRSLRRVATRA